MDERLISKNITLYFTILCALFIAMSPQFMGFILPLIFLLPIIMALSGLKHRKKSGFLIAMAIIPLALSVSVIWIKYSISTFTNMSAEMARISTEYNVSETLAQLLTFASFILSIIMVGFCGIVFTKLLKYKKIFK